MCCNSWGHKELDMTEQLNKDLVSFFQQYKEIMILI